MKIFTKIIPVIALTAIALVMSIPTKADVVVAPKNKPSLVITALVGGKAVSTNIVFFADEHEAIEYENALLASNPETNPLKPGKKLVYIVTEVFVK